MPPKQIMGIWDADDDWTTLECPDERRKRQNRISQRIWRKRRHTERCATTLSRESTDSDSHPLAWLNSSDERKHQSAIAFVHMVLFNTSVPLQVPQSALTLAQLNVLNAFFSNAATLSISPIDLANKDALSPFNVYGPEHSDALSLQPTIPQDLRPTDLQIAVPYHPLLDLLPIPSLRDGILTAYTTTGLTNDMLCKNLWGEPDGWDGSDTALAPLVVWGVPHDARSWQMSLRLIKELRSMRIICS
ncbi:hypothetical protein BU24DRAFT_492940 [Aaosphaeria arxii CBS 175.79]|uniref:BZIP domain-containing protein n=1 Tax=Aaosphaeria arxii CBS 175.79 TaxID=1450172 RepID=A0A6A5XNF0_9PLEO|nr:uncharacterized protein BU24DRAFT_492940 [Aaosphaeria arxii CBS 175.79]KAF2014270.1 hypothetical protein BU24DRAFT_492940 [Aaosphaeria arxii CBS 175.79]